MKEIEVTVDLDGKVSIDLAGYKGSECEQVAEQLAKALGEKLESVKKNEYYQQNVDTKQKISRS